ncbi:single-stranded DNA-binding protein [Streptomyces sp. CC208A]|uniref:single-stranded DNA-binding protein n=1 Tax=Streptomyces sp. CC208A TaxID=3044573 RepID=UPI0024A808E0|nr:single-stranded DNA-binding protein [Streptomyces sp. CC208A]
MNDTTVTLVGNVATAVEYRDTVAGAVARFRFAVTARRWDRERAVWVDGATSFYTVSAWRTLGANLAASVSVGEPLVVHGRLKVREDEREGQRKTFVDIDALAVGHDLTRGTSAFRRTVRNETARNEPRPAAQAPPGAGGSGLAEGDLTDREETPGLVPADVKDPWTAAAHQLVTAS